VPQREAGEEVSSPLDRIEAKMQNRMFGQWPVIHPDTVLALVNVAKAAERQAEREPGSLDTAIREALAALGKEPA